MNKHAYLITAHNNFAVLEKLLSALDDPRNDIYVHIDRRSKTDLHRFKSKVKRSGLYFINRLAVNWGAYSQTRAELELFSAATVRCYDYYHLISGTDIPIKSQDYIHDFFQGKSIEYIKFNIEDSDEARDASYMRVRYFHLLLENKHYIHHKRMKKFNKLFVVIQQRLGIDKYKKHKLLYDKGENWCSITHEFAAYLVENKKLIAGFCRYSLCSDEIYKQILLINSPFRERAIGLTRADSDNLRYTDWSVGYLHPKVLTMDDIDAVMNSGAIFARKFDEKISAEAVDKILSLV